MKKLLGILVVLFLSLSSSAFASNFGPAQPNAAPGNFYFGLGAQHHEADWETDVVADNKAEQEIIFGQLGYVFGGGAEAYLKAGAADLEFNDPFGGGVDIKFDSEDAAPFASVGLKAPLGKMQKIDVAFFIEGTYMGSFEDSAASGSTTIDVEFEESIKADAGLILQIELEGAHLYGGPVLFFHEGDLNVDTSDGSFSDSGTFEEEEVVGAFLGINWPLKNGVNINIEGQLKSDFSFGGGVTFPF